MPFFIHAEDKPGALETRKANRDAHLAYVKDNYNDAIISAGPKLADDGETMIGSVILIDLPDRAAVDEFCKNDPYAQAGLFETVTVTAYKPVFPMKD